jgi:glycosyltransferase involved in cell wall biosynthesis
MRVLHVYRTYFPDTQGGLEEVIRQICLTTGRHDVQSRVLSLTKDRDPATLTRTEALVCRAPLTAEVASCGVSTKAFSLYRTQAVWADLIHYHFPWPFADVLHLTSAVRRPSIVTYHSDIVRQRLLSRLYGPLMRRFLGSMDQIICTSPNYFTTSPVLTQFRDKVSIIPIGLDEAEHHSPSPELLGEVQQQFGNGFFLFVGVLRYYKGLHILLEAARNAPYRIVIVGAGPVEQELKAQTARLGLGNIVFAGRVSDKVKGALYQLCRAVVFPSYLRSEAFGVTLVEGAIHHRPLISTEIGTGTSYVNQDQQTGFVVPPSSPQRLRDEMDWLHNNPARAEQMGRAARARYEELFTGDLMGHRYQMVYKAVAKGTAIEGLGAEFLLGP